MFLFDSMVCNANLLKIVGIYFSSLSKWYIMHWFCFILLKKFTFWSSSEQMWITSSTQSIFYKNWNFEELFSSLLANLMNERPWRYSYLKTTIKNKVDKGLNDYRKSQLTIKTKTKNTCYYFIVLSLRIKMKTKILRLKKSRRIILFYSKDEWESLKVEIWSRKGNTFLPRGIPFFPSHFVRFTLLC